jgi:hypothetical protein
MMVVMVMVMVMVVKGRRRDLRKERVSWEMKILLLRDNGEMVERISRRDCRQLRVRVLNMKIPSVENTQF